MTSTSCDILSPNQSVRKDFFSIDTSLSFGASEEGEGISSLKEFDKKFDRGNTHTLRELRDNDSI